MCILMSSDVPHPARVHWREVAKHDQLHGKTPGGMYVCRVLRVMQCGMVQSYRYDVWYGA